MRGQGRRRRERNQERADAAKRSWLGEGFNERRRQKSKDADEKAIRKAVEEQRPTRRMRDALAFVKGQGGTGSKDGTKGRGAERRPAPAGQGTNDQDKAKRPVIVVAPTPTVAPAGGGGGGGGGQKGKAAAAAAPRPQAKLSAKKKAFLDAKKAKKRKQTTGSGPRGGLDDAAFTRGVMEPPRLPALKRKRTV